MKLTDLTKRIASLHKTAQKRRHDTSDAALQTWLQGYLDGLDEVTEIIKRELEIERTEQRLARLKNEQAQEPQPDWSRAPEGAAKEATKPANTNTGDGALKQMASVQEAA